MAFLLATASSGHLHNFLPAAAGGLAFAGFRLVPSTCEMGFGPASSQPALGLSWLVKLGEPVQGRLGRACSCRRHGAHLLAACTGSLVTYTAWPFMIACPAIHDR
jgi:hypothetical protein